MYAVSGATTHTYETLLCDASSAVPRFNKVVANSHHNITSHSPAYNVPPEVPQWILAATVPQTTDSSSPFYKMFLNGKPLALGIILIVSAILQIGLGVALFFTWTVLSIYSGITFWGSIFYIIAGALTIAAQAKPNICLVKGSLSLNIISSIVSVIALILYGIDLAINHCYNGNSSYYILCLENRIYVYIVDILLIVINLLVFCVTLSVSIFGCRSLSNLPSNVTQVFVMQNDGALPHNPSTVPPFPLPQQPKSKSNYVNAI